VTGTSRLASIVCGVAGVAALVLAGCGSASDGGPDVGPAEVTVTSTVWVAPLGSATGSAGSGVRSAGSESPSGASSALSAPAAGSVTDPGSVTASAGSAAGPATSVSGPVGSVTASAPSSSAPGRPAGVFTLALAGDVNFSERTADLLAADPDTALQQAGAELDGADITMVNLETAITTRGTPAPKQFHFRAPATALRALAAGGVDVATMANNHAADYGDQGLADTVAAIKKSPIPVIGIGGTATQAYAPYRVTVNGVRLAILAASQVQDWTLGAHTATSDGPGIASAYSDRLVAAVRAAAAKADVVVVYLHWGIEYQTCPSEEQRALADTLADAGAAAVVGTHAHVLQGAGWRDDGVYVAYGLGNYYWWRSFGNEQDDNGVLTLTFDRGRVSTAHFLATHLDDRGVPLAATGTQKQRILDEWQRDRECADLAARPPR